MNWKKAKYALPAHKQEVLIRRGTAFSVAVFDSTLTKFILNNGEIIDPAETNLEWLGKTETNKK